MAVVCTDAERIFREATLLPPSGHGSFFFSPLKVLLYLLVSVLSIDIYSLYVVIFLFEVTVHFI